MKNRFKIDRNEFGSVSFIGSADMRFGIVLAENSEYIVVKFPGGMHWSSRGKRSYHSPSVYVLRKDADGWLYQEITWDSKRV